MKIEINIGGKKPDPFDRGCKAAAVGILNLGCYLTTTDPGAEDLREILAYLTVVLGIVSVDNFTKHFRQKKAKVKQ